jgi:hypothetical protein
LKIAFLISGTFTLALIRRDICNAIAPYNLIVAKKKKRRLGSQHLKKKSFSVNATVFFNLLDYRPFFAYDPHCQPGSSAQRVVRSLVDNGAESDCDYICVLDIHGSMPRDTTMKITNKMLYID